MRGFLPMALLALSACTKPPVHPTYEFETGYGANVAPPAAIAADLEAYASPDLRHRRLRDSRSDLRRRLRPELRAHPLRLRVA